ncbi:hypothetical protein KS4_29970 [Poriferisphaera corsica]|uniref:DUF4396 domain-containing protein n=1 Tax=Poriferisphaera corsica TaxID=2528020 RepID=A0A517YXI4_9BACT|nr:DUF4396 domain-containing protein [Poriferisphaera corsica]QDU34920.1 hypothetical protein KS4_29970 [Poriferisphaera corsica]
MNPGDLFLLFWLLISILIAVWVYQDLGKRSPTLNLMKPAWILICIYTGLFGLLIYELTCRSTKPLIPHSTRYSASSYRKASSSTVQSTAGAATGIIIAASLSSILNLPTMIEYLLEYLLAYIFAIFVFHGLYHANTYYSYPNAIKEIILPETISINFILAAIFPTNALCFQYIPMADHPTLIRFWFVMQLATIVGFGIAYPLIHWLILNNLKPCYIIIQPKRNAYPTPKHMKPIKEIASNSKTNDPTPEAIYKSKIKTQLIIALLLSFLLLAAGFTLAIYITPILPHIDLSHFIY